MRRKLLHPITADMRREIDIRALTKAGGFIRPMRFPFKNAPLELLTIVNAVLAPLRQSKLICLN